MIRKAYIIGTLVAGLAVAALQGAPGIGRIASSVHNFEHYFHNLKSGNSLSSVERFVFSLVLANTDAAASQKTTAPAPRSSSLPGTY